MSGVVSPARLPGWMVGVSGPVANRLAGTGLSPSVVAGDSVFCEIACPGVAWHGVGLAQTRPPVRMSFPRNSRARPGGRVGLYRPRR